MEVTVKKIAGRLTAEIPAEALETLGVKEGERLNINPARLSELRVTRANLAAARTVIDENDGALEKLARSERGDLVDEIMDQYDNALAELAK